MPPVRCRRTRRFRFGCPGESTGESDVDVTYVLAPGHRLGWEIEDLTDELSALFGRRVDLVSRRALHPRIADQVIAESRVLYAA